MSADVDGTVSPVDSELRKRIAALSDESLAKMVVLESKNYRADALAVAAEEIERRKLTIDALKDILTTALNRPPPVEIRDAGIVPGIRGWLILPAMGMIANPLLILRDMVDTWGGQSGKSLLLLVLTFDITLLVFVCITAYSFFSRNRRAPRMVVTFLALSLVFELIIGAYVVGNYDVPVVRFLWEQAKGSLVAAAVWIPYFLCSERVKRTFVRE